MTRKAPWGDVENRRCVRLYFEMLHKAMAGEKYVKAHMIRDARYADDAMECRRELWNRSRTSIEFKLMNCTAIHRELRPHDETMHGHGYRAMPNYQAELKQAMVEELDRLDAEAADRPAAAG